MNLCLVTPTSSGVEIDLDNQSEKGPTAPKRRQAGDQAKEAAGTVEPTLHPHLLPNLAYDSPNNSPESTNYNLKSSRQDTDTQVPIDKQISNPEKNTVLRLDRRDLPFRLRDEIPFVFTDI